MNRIEEIRARLANVNDYEGVRKFNDTAGADVSYLLAQVAAMAEIVQAMRDQHYYETDCSGCADNFHNANTVLGTFDALPAAAEGK